MGNSESAFPNPEAGCTDAAAAIATVNTAPPTLKSGAPKAAANGSLLKKAEASKDQHGGLTMLVDPYMSNDYEVAIKACKELAFCLETEFGSSGGNLHELITNVNTALPIDVIMNMRYVATIGNNLAHESTFSSIPDKQEFWKRYQRSLQTLHEIAAQRIACEQRMLEEQRHAIQISLEQELKEQDKNWIDQQQQDLMERRQRLILERQAAAEIAAIIEQERVAKWGVCAPLICA